MWHAMQVIAGAIEWINDPDMIAFTFRPVLLSEDRVIRVIALDFTYNLLFAGFVNFGDIVMPGLACNGNTRNFV